MLSKKTLLSETQSLDQLRGLVEVNQEIAATHIQKVQNEVTSARTFNQGINAMYAQVMASLSKLKSSSSGQSAVVFISANTGLYGAIVNQTFTKFADHLHHHPDSHVFVVGQVGQTLVTAAFPNQTIKAFPFPDDQVDSKSLSQLVSALSAYQTIHIFHGHFDTLASQSPTQTSFSADNPDLGADLPPPDPNIHYLYEPSLQELSRVFHQQIFASLVEQTLHENNLAKNASRLIQMDTALQNIHYRLQRVGYLQSRLRHHLKNKKQLTRLSALKAAF